MKKLLPLLLCYLFIALMCLYYAKTAPTGFEITPDGQNYLKMADSLTATRTTIYSAHWQKMIMPVTVGVFSRFFDWSYVDGFLYLSKVSFLILALFLFYQLQREIKSYLVPLALTFLLMQAYWTIRFNLFDFYQLCDLWAYFFGLGVLFALRRNNFWAFVLFAIPGMFNRQNFWFLAVPGVLYFLYRAYNEYKKDHQGKRLVAPALALGLFTVIVIALMKLPGGNAIDGYITDDPYIPSLFFRMSYLYHIGLMMSPFFPAYIEMTKPLKKYLYQYWPLLIYLLFSFGIPFNINLKHESDAIEFSFVSRICYQALWLFHIMACIKVGRRLRDMDKKGLAIAGVLFVMTTLHRGVYFGGTLIFLYLAYLRWKEIKLLKVSTSN